jgi:hypothetical protein
VTRRGAPHVFGQQILVSGRGILHAPVEPRIHMYMENKTGVTGVLRSSWIDRARPGCPSGFAI